MCFDFQMNHKISPLDYRDFDIRFEKLYSVVLDFDSLMSTHSHPHDLTEPSATGKKKPS